MTASTLAQWFGQRGRHSLPWRQTTDPWPVFVSEVMLQQTSVSRVREPWLRFMQRWPTAAAMSKAPLDDVLREWKGLGYPRRARALWECAGHVAAKGWPQDEAGLRQLPGIGEYTARALLCFAFGRTSSLPRDVNIARVAARAWLGNEAHDIAPAELDNAIARRQPRDMDNRSYAFALFDIGATLCTARSVECQNCPLRRGCQSRTRLASGVPRRPIRQPAYAGSFRELRGAVLAAALRGATEMKQLRADVGHLPQAQVTGAIEKAMESLRRDGLIPA